MCSANSGRRTGLSPAPWEVGREQALLELQNIDQAYASVTGNSKESATGILDKYRSDYKVSIEDFAGQINEYIQRQGPGFRELLRG